MSISELVPKFEELCTRCESSVDYYEKFVLKALTALEKGRSRDTEFANNNNWEKLGVITFFITDFK